MRGPVKAAATLGLALNICQEMTAEYKIRGGTFLTKINETAHDTEQIIKSLERVKPKELDQIDTITEKMNTIGLSYQPSWQIYLAMAIGCISDRVVEIQSHKPNAPIAIQINSLIKKYQRLHTYFASRTRRTEWDDEGTRLYTEWEKLLN